jgi:hypothetical protein
VKSNFLSNQIGGEFMVATNYVFLQDAKASEGDLICATLPLLVTFFAAIASINPNPNRDFCERNT